MILAAGLTPAWQQILRFRTLELGEVNRAAEVYWCASGKVLNAGMALASLGVESHTLSPVGGWSGSAIRNEFSERNIPATWTPTAHATRVCTTVLNEADGSTTELVENAAALAPGEEADFRWKYRDLLGQANVVVLTGSLPLETGLTFYRYLIQETTCPVVMDARGTELWLALEYRPRVVKPNRAELELTVGRALPDQQSVLAAMRELVEKGAQAVVVTQGKRDVLVMEGRDAWELTPPVVAPIVNPIGCGDCLAAGIAWGLSRGDSVLDAVRLGMAAAADNVTQVLPARLSPDRVRAFLNRIEPPRGIPM